MTAQPQAIIRPATHGDVPQLLVLYRELDEFHQVHHPELYPTTIST